MEHGALAIGATADAAADGGSCRVIDNRSGNSAALTEEALALARAAQRRLTALSGQQNSGVISFNCTLHARARARPAPTGLVGAAAAADGGDFVLAEWCWRIRGDDGALAIGATADAAAAGGGGSCRVIDNRSEILQH